MFAFAVGMRDCAKPGKMSYNSSMETPLSDKTETEPNRRGHPPFAKGNKHAVGHKPPSLIALRRQFIREYLTKEIAGEILDAQREKATKEKDTVAAKFVFDYCGEKPVEVTETNNNTLFAKLGIEVIGKENKHDGD